MRLSLECAHGALSPGPLLVSVIQMVPGCGSSATDLRWCENVLLWAAVDAEVTSD